MPFSKLIEFFTELSFEDFVRKVCYYFYLQSRTALEKVRGLMGGLYFKRYDIMIGRGVLIRGVTRNIKVGGDFRIYDYSIFEFDSRAEFRIGESCVFSYGVLLSCKKSIIIGDYVQVGEYSSIRDTTHCYQKTELPMKLQQDTSSRIVIGNDVWIGRGCIVMPGTKISDGVVIGANSVVKGHLERFGVYAGAPAKFIKYRQP